jgi:hypothetical protein
MKKMVKPPMPMGKKMGKAPGYKAGGAVFKPCAGCKNPKGCAAAGKCMAKGK